MTTSAQQWDTMYKASKYCGNQHPTDVLDSLFPDLKPEARVLDLGCGIGRNSILLAQQGFEVHAMDISNVAIEYLRTKMARAGIPAINAWAADLRHEEFNGLYDLILAYGVLNSIEHHWWQKIIDNMKKHTSPGGYNSIVVFNDYSDLSSLDGVNVVTLSKPNEILAEYRGWLLKKEDIRTICHSHGQRRTHMHVVERYIFQKPISKKYFISNVFKENIQNIAVIGPTRPFRSANALGIKQDLFINAAIEVGTFIAKSGRRLVCIPDLGVGKLVFDTYSANSPILPALILKPNYDERFTAIRDSAWEKKITSPVEILQGFSWTEQAIILAQHSDAFLVVGLSCGALMELLWTRWLKKPVYMSLDISSSLPPEVRSRLSIFELPTISNMLQAFKTRHPEHNL